MVPIWGFSSFRFCSFYRYAASSCVACSCRFSLLLSLFLVGLPCWQLFWFKFLAVCSVYGSSFLVCRAAFLFSVVCRLVWLGPPPSLASSSYLESCSFASFLFSFSSPLLGLCLSSGSSAGVRFGSSSFFSSGARFWWFLACRWSGHPLCVYPCVLRGVSGFQAHGVLDTCLLLTGAPGFGSFSFSSAPLSICFSLFQPSYLWGLFLVGCGVCLWCLRPSSCASLFFFLRRLFISLRFLRGLAYSCRSIPFLRWGPALLFPIAPAQSVLPALSGALGGFTGSLLCLPPGSGSSSFLGSLWFWLGVSAPFHAGPPLGLSSAPWLFHRFLPPVSSVLPLFDFSLLCYLASWLVLGSSFQVLVEPGLPLQG